MKIDWQHVKVGEVKRILSEKLGWEVGLGYVFTMPWGVACSLLDASSVLPGSLVVWEIKSMRSGKRVMWEYS